MRNAQYAGAGLPDLVTIARTMRGGRAQVTWGCFFAARLWPARAPVPFTELIETRRCEGQKGRSLKGGWLAFHTENHGSSVGKTNHTAGHRRKRARIRGSPCQASAPVRPTHSWGRDTLRTTLREDAETVVVANTWFGIAVPGNSPLKTRA